MALGVLGASVFAQEVPTAEVEGQPLAANIRRLAEAMEYLGVPLPQELSVSLEEAGRKPDAARLQELLDRRVLLVVTINPESRVKVRRGPGAATLAQGGYTPVLVKVINEATATQPMRITSPQGGAVYAGGLDFSLTRQGQTRLNENQNTEGEVGRFLDVRMFDDPPMTDRLSGLRVEYAVALIYSTESGKREATIGFDIGQGTQDLGFRGQTPILFDIHPAVPVTVRVRDENGQPSMARLEVRDEQGRVYPPQPKRLAPDLFFQPQVYRADGEKLLLPPGTFTVRSSRGPEYLAAQQPLTVYEGKPAELDIRLKRWVDPRLLGFYSGDHHIHAAGCAHYNIPTIGIEPGDVLRQVKGEGLNVGCVLSWAYGWEHQNRFFTPEAHPVSEPLTLVKYDVEISGFASAAMGHVCLLNLKDVQYPGSQGTGRGWPTWNTPVLRWAKSQGGVTGYAHSAMPVDPPGAAAQLLKEMDADGNGLVSVREAGQSLLPEPFARSDFNADGLLSLEELTQSHERAADTLPNLAMPGTNGAGALEIFVSTAEGLCDFISAMDTARIHEWNTWYHLLNCGLPLKVSGETDYPCMSSRRVGQGRVYVQLGQVDRLRYGQWIESLGKGRSYVSDGYAHALKFTVNDRSPGFEDVAIATAGKVKVRATVAFAAEQPLDVPYGGRVPPVGLRKVGDTVVLYGPRTQETQTGGQRLVEVVVNGRAVAGARVPADGQSHDLAFDIPIERSGWVTLRQFPQLHTNPVNVIVGGGPIRASRSSALWCAKAVERLWDSHNRFIAQSEREAAQESYRKAIERYRQIAAECPPGT